MLGDLKRHDDDTSRWRKPADSWLSHRTSVLIDPFEGLNEAAMLRKCEAAPQDVMRTVMSSILST